MTLRIPKLTEAQTMRLFEVKDAFYGYEKTMDEVVEECINFYVSDIEGKIQMAKDEEQN